MRIAQSTRLSTLAWGMAYSPSYIDWLPVPVPEQVAVTERQVPVPGGASLWCWDTGGPGEPVVLLHPASGSGESWPYQQPVLAGHGLRVIGYSRRGRFRSAPGPAGPAAGPARPARPAGHDRPTARPASADLHALVEHLDLPAFHLLGAAAGGCIALDYALSYGDRLRGLVLAGSLAGIAEPGHAARSSALRPVGFDDLPLEFRELGPSYRGGNPDGVAAWLEIARRAGPQGGPGAEPRLPFANTVTRSALATLDTPVPLVTGDADLYAPPSMARLVAGQLPRCRTVVVPEAGHNAHWEQPEVFTTEVLRFLLPLRQPGPVTTGRAAPTAGRP